MARTSEEKLTAIDIKIEKMKKKADIAERRYQEVMDKLEGLMEKRDAIRNSELINAISTSDKTFEEIMEFLGSTKEKTTRGRKKKKK